MSIYFQTTPAGIPEKTTPAKGICAAHATEPLFAFSTLPGGRVLICNDEGDTVHELATSPAAPTAISFHPTRALYGVGYRNGSFSLTGCGVENLVTNSTLSHFDHKEQPQIHQVSPITALAFGTSLVDDEESDSSSSSSSNNKKNNTGNVASNINADAVISNQQNNNNNNNKTQFNQTGDFMYMTTQDKIVSAWSLSTEQGGGVLSALWNAKLPSPVTHITRGNGFLFMHTNTSPNVIVLDESAQTVSIGVNLAQTETAPPPIPGAKGDQAGFGTPIRSVWDSKNRTLLILTSNVYLISFKVGFDGKMTQTSFRKLNTSAINDTNLLQLTLVSAGIVAIAAGDATIRVIAWANDTNVLVGGSKKDNKNPTASSLYFPDAAFGGATVAQQQVVVSLASSNRGRICAGNRAGQVAVWQFVGSLESIDEFQLVAHVGPPTSLSQQQQHQQPHNQQHNATNALLKKQSPAAGAAKHIDNFAVDRVVISNSSNGSALILGVEYVQLLQGTVRQRKWHGKAMVLQTSPSEVVVQNTSGATFNIFPTTTPEEQQTGAGAVNKHVRGVDIYWPNVLLWTGKNADVFSLAETTGAVTPVASFEQPLSAVALYADGVILSRSDKIQMTTFTKHANYSIGVAEAEGTPQAIHVAEDVGAMVTNKGSLRVFRIGARDLKTVGPARQLRTPNGHAVSNIGMMAINRTGKKVAFTTSGIVSSSSSSSSGDDQQLQLQLQQQQNLAASVFVHDVDTDSVFEFCFGDDRSPSFFSWNMAILAGGLLLQSNNNNNAGGGGGGGGVGATGPDTESVLLAVETRIIKFKSASAAVAAATATAIEEIKNTETTATATPASTTTTLSSSALASKTQYLPESVIQQNYPQQQQQQSGGDASGILSLTSSADRHITTLFAAPRGVYHHHTFPLHAQQSGLIGCSVPHLVLGIQLEADMDEDAEFTTDKNHSPVSSVVGGANIVRYEHSLFLKPLRDFDGMQQAESDVKLRTALMQFAYFAAIGNMDEAYKAVKLVKDPAIWVNMAKMCVSTKRIDVAEVCLSNMQDTVAARAVRETRDEENIDVRIATLAMTLGMVDDAERLLRKCKRFDLLTELYIACGRWEQAVTNCEQHDRLRTTSVFFRQAQQAETSFNYDLALQLYGRAKCLGTESPRLFFATNRVEELQTKIAETDDKDLLIWWAQYLECKSEVQEALNCYKRARDGFNVIRLLVSQNQIETAEDLLRISASAATTTTTTLKTGGSDDKENNKNNTNNNQPLFIPAGAAFFIARHYEHTEKNFNKAVQMYERSAAFENAIRIAKEHDMHVDVLRISLKCGNNHTALESGRYFEERNMYDKAVQLYRQGGDNQKAIDVCIKGGLFDELHRISESLEQGAEPETFIAMASHFEKSGHYNKAVEMLVFGKAFNEALQLCLDHNVKLTDAMAEAMTLPKSDNPEDEEYRMNLLRKIAKVAKDQESYHLACKKYTQCGEVMKGMKSLLRSGDTEKIIFFANHIRNQEVYFATANFLQSTNWAQDQTIFKSIVNLYTKAKAFESLALFYDTAAQHQIDENRSYEKAAGLLREGQKALEKGGDTISPIKREQLARRVAAVDAFVRAVSLIKGPASSAQPASPQTQSEFVALCTDLLDRARPPHPDAELIRSAIRVGDVSALLAEYYANSEQNNKFHKAYQILEQMHADGIQLNLFIDPVLMKKITDGAGTDAAPFTQIPDQQFRRKSSVVPQKKKPAQDDVAETVDEEI